MKLLDIYSAKFALQKLSNLPLKPVVAYKVMKFMGRVQEELEFIEKTRVGLVRKYHDGPEQDNISLDPTSEVFVSFKDDFLETLDVDSEMEPIPFSLSELVDNIIGEVGFSIVEMGQLEPLFES